MIIKCYLILKKCGFRTRKAKFNDSAIKEMRTPLHVMGMKKKQNLNQKFYKKTILHVYKNGKYNINFKCKVLIGILKLH